MKINNMSSSVSVNGKTYIGNSIVVSNGRVVINGLDATPENSKEINISVEGNVEKLDVDVCNKINITGNATNISTKSGDIDITGNVGGSVQTMSGDVKCGDIGGSVNTMSGDIKHRRS